MWLAYSFVHAIEIPINRVVFIFCVLIIGAVSLGQRYNGECGVGEIDTRACVTAFGNVFNSGQ